MTTRGHDVWTPRDLDIVAALTVRCRLMTLAQIAANWWPPKTGTNHNVSRSLSRLVDAGLLEEYEVDVEMLPEFTAPLAHWRPGPDRASTIDAHAVSYRLQSRWTGSSERTCVYAPSALAAHLYGAHTSGLQALHQATHDVHVAEVFLLYRRRNPGQVARWRGEACFRKAGFGIKDPDAFILDESFRPRMVVEFGGKYPAERVAAFDDHCRTHELPYELW